MAKKVSIVQASRTAKAMETKARKTADSRTADAKTNDSFVNFAQRMGVGGDNALSSASYGFNPISRNRVQLEWIHRGSWIGGVAVDVVADDMTRAGVDIEGEVEATDIEIIEESAVTLNIWNSINDAIKWARLYGGSIVVMMIDGQDQSSPLRLDTVSKDQFRGLLIFDRWMVDPSLSDLVTEMGPSIGLPKFYKVNGSAPYWGGKKVHFSRCIRLEGIHLPYWQRVTENLWGVSVIERLFDRMIAFDSATTGAAQLVYKSYLRTMKVKDLREIVSSGGPALMGLTSYIETMRRFQGIEGISMIDSEDELTTETHGAFSGLSDALAQFGQQLSGALQIPLVRLFGQSPSGFSTGDADMQNYYDGIYQKQEKELREGVSKIYRCLAASEQVELPEGFKIKFKSLWEMDAEKKANVAGTTTSTILAAHSAGLISDQVALMELRQSSQDTGVFSNITQDLIDAAEEDPVPAAEQVQIQEGPEGKSSTQPDNGAEAE